MNKKTKSRNFTTDELYNLLNIIEKTPALTSKKTDAVTNTAKDAAWGQLAQDFNADNGGIYRDVSQLKLKWDNLKKAAKKRASAINANYRANGGREGDMIIPDPILDRIIGIIKLLNGIEPRSLFDDDSGHVVLEFSQDLELVVDAGVASDTVHNTVIEKSQLDEGPQTSEITPNAAVGSVVRDSNVSVVRNTGCWNPLLKTPMNAKLKLTKRKTLEEELIKSKIRKNNAIASYYEYKLKNKINYGSSVE